MGDSWTDITSETRLDPQFVNDPDNELCLMDKTSAGIIKIDAAYPYSGDYTLASVTFGEGTEGFIAPIYKNPNSERPNLDYFSAYIGRSDYGYYIRRQYAYDPQNWTISYYSSSLDLLYTDVISADETPLLGYFYEFSIPEGGECFSYISFTPKGTAIVNKTADMGYGYAISVDEMTFHAVPEPSSLLALAFGGAGTALAIRKRKQR